MLEAKGKWACFRLFSCRFSQHSLSTQQLTQPCVFRDNLHSTGLVYMKGWHNPAVKACYGLIAWGRSQRRSPDPDLHHPTQSRSTQGERNVGVCLAKLLLTQSKSPSPPGYLCWWASGYRKCGYRLLSLNVITASLVEHTGLGSF